MKKMTMSENKMPETTGDGMDEAMDPEKLDRVLARFGGERRQDEHLTLALDVETRRKLRAFATLRGMDVRILDVLLLDALDVAHTLLLTAATSKMAPEGTVEVSRKEAIDYLAHPPLSGEELDSDARDVSLKRFTSELSDHLARRHGVEEQDVVVYSQHSGIIKVHHEAVGLYLRYRSTLHEQWDRHADLVIAGVFFKEQRQGHGRALLSFIASVAPSHGIERVILESTSRAGAAFAEGMGFHAIDLLARCWAISVNDLRANLVTPQVHAPRVHNLEEETP